MVNDTLIEISKIGIRSIFTVKKYDSEILDEDLSRILFIKNYIEDSLQFVEENYSKIDAKVYFNELKKYALELFMEQCEETRLDEKISSKEFNLEEYQKEDKEFFNYVYDNRKYPDNI